MLEEAFGSLQGIVNCLGVDFGCLIDSTRTGIGSLEKSMTEQVGVLVHRLGECFKCQVC